MKLVSCFHSFLLNVLGIGLINESTTFQRPVHINFIRLMHNFVEVYLDDITINSVTTIFETKHRLTRDSRQIRHEMMQRYCNRRLQLCIINNRMSNIIQCHAKCMNSKTI